MWLDHIFVYIFDQYVERIALCVASPPYEGLFQTTCLVKECVLVPPACILAICFCKSSGERHADTAKWLKDVLRTETSEEPSIEPIFVIPASPTESQIATLQAELARTSRRFHLSCQARQLETARADRLAAEVARIRGTLEAYFDISFDYGMLRVSFICKLEEFKQEYISHWIREHREDEFQQLKQEGMTVAQYIAQFNHLDKYFEAATVTEIAYQMAKLRATAMGPS
ncbi:hypothetical protein M9H77_22210 [Catharanthus roseus]|uniref:Uncharacterized protein n=1 Tax=Catharanthus roseus TaxID=4058 RepID=A0ACC0AR13_CATRO|nr:hypothetical protein M9H77_22210 [Catharanthus roseus]